MGKKKDVITDKELCPGIVLGKEFFEQKENRLLTLFVKGFIVYLMSMGSIGFYLSAFGIEYNYLLCHIVIFIMAILCASLYYRLLVENTGYLILLAVFAFLVINFRTVINSGFYAIVNITVDSAAQYFDVDIQRLYSEQITDRYLTVTCVVLFIGIVLDILLNVYISRRMQYVTSIFIVMTLNMVPLYMVFEPDTFYTIMLLAGIAMALIYKSGKHYSPQVSIKRKSNIYEEKKIYRFGKNKKDNESEISYVYNVKGMLYAGVYAVLFVFIVVVIISNLKPKEAFNAGYETNVYKKKSMSAMSTLLMDGWEGFFRLSDDVGGMHGGRLGDVSSIHLDYQTDLLVQFTPFSYDTFYIKGFVGEIYNPYENIWTDINDVNGMTQYQTAEADALRDGYEDGNSNTSRGVLRLRNVGVAPKLYMPYYLSFDSVIEDAKRSSVYEEFVYYPRIQGNQTVVERDRYIEGAPYTQMDLYVPEENVEAIEEIVIDANLYGSEEQIIQNLIDYYQDNIPYTIRPGKTPRGEDFVNYFLLENKKGYCSHYATSAVLIFRYLGIPARYVEGYAIDYYQMTEGELVSDRKYEDYYSGYAPLGETAMVEINVTDADAHAWVEVYDRDYGWIVVEVTPSGATEEVEDFWTLFADFMDENGEAGDTGEIENRGGFRLPTKFVQGIVDLFITLMVVFSIAIILLVIVRLVIEKIRYSKYSINDKLIYKYTEFCKSLRKRHKDFRSKTNYTEQVEYIFALNNEKANKKETKKDQDFSQEKIIDILERAGFSNKAVSAQEFEYIINWIK